MKSTNLRLLASVLMMLSILLSACSHPVSSPGTKETGGKDTGETTAATGPSKYIEEKFMLGKDLQAEYVYPNALPIEKGTASIRLLLGTKESISRLLVVKYEDNLEYKWSSKNRDVVECFDGIIMAKKAGNTQVELVLKSGEAVVTVDVSVYQDMASRIEKAVQLAASFYYPTLTVVDNYLYIGTAEKITGPKAAMNYFYKLDTDLNIIWQHELGGLETRGSAVLDSAGNIYFVVHDRKQAAFAEANTVPTDQNGLCWFITTYLYSLTPDGKFRFSRELSYKTIDQRYGQINCAIDKNNTVYVADCRLFAFDTEGNALWQYPRDNNEFMISRSSPVFDGQGNLYLPMSKYDPVNHHANADGSAGNMVYDTALYSFAPDSNGTPRWSVAVENRVSMPPCSFNYDYTRLFLPLNQTLYCLNPLDGALLWKYSLNIPHGEFRANAAVDDAGNIYIGTKGDYESTLYAFKADGSGILWQTALGGDIYTSAVLGDDRMLYITSETSYKGAFYAIDLRNGEIRWTLPGTGNNYEGGGYPRLKDGYLYLDSGKTILKVKVDAGNHLPKAGWATFRGSNASTGRRAG